MTVLIPYGEAEVNKPSHKCDSCGHEMKVWPIPWELAWPKRGGGHLCSNCYFEQKEGTATNAT